MELTMVTFPLLRTTDVHDYVLCAIIALLIWMVVSNRRVLPSKRKRLPTSHSYRIAQRDANLWRREKEIAEKGNPLKMLCPCIDCKGLALQDLKSVEAHVLTRPRHPWCRVATPDMNRESSDDDWDEIDTGGSREGQGPRPSLQRHESGGHGLRPNWHPTTTTPTSTANADDTGIPHGDTRLEQMLADIFGNMQEYEPGEEGAPVNQTADGIRSHPQEPGFEDEIDQAFKEAFEPLYAGSKQTILEFTLSLLNLCTEHRVTQVFQDNLFSFLRKQVVPDKNAVPVSLYKAQELVGRLGLNYEIIHACPNGCVLFRHEFKDLEQCPNPECKENRYKRGPGKIRVSIVKYFPLIPRLLWMFRCPSLAEHMTWANINKSTDGLVHHAGDCNQWKELDALYPEHFARELCNLRLGLLLDGVNPFNIKSSKHSIWPIMVVNYGLPPWLLTKPFFIMLSVLVSGKKGSPIKQDRIDVYLQPLIEELQLLWEGVPAYDRLHRYGSSRFTLRAALLWTIGDYPAQGYISGLCTGGAIGCFACGGAGPATKSRLCRKSCHTSSRRFLPMDHPWRGPAFAHLFDGRPEFCPPIPRQTAKHILEKAQEKEAYFAAGGTKDSPENPYKRWGVHHRSSLFDLPYWSQLPIRHCIDVMHLGKNVSENLVLHLLGVKDTQNVRDHLQEMGIRPHLWKDAVRTDSEPGSLPHAPYTFTVAEKKLFLERLRAVQAPEGHSSNWGSKVEMPRQAKDWKLFGMKSHDYHVLLLEVLPACIRGMLHEDVCKCIFALSHIYQQLCSKSVDLSKYDELFNFTVKTLCRFEMHFPPTFFVVMTHLIIHAVEELYWCGPVQTRWMYFGERILGHYTRYVKNNANISGSIAASYVREETLGLCTEYLDNVDTYRIRVWDSEEEPSVAGEVLKGGATPYPLNHEELNKIHLFVLNSWAQLQPWRNKYAELQQQPSAVPLPPFELWVAAAMEEHFRNHPDEDTDLYYITKRPLNVAHMHTSMWAYGSYYEIVNESEKGGPTYGSGVRCLFPVPVSNGSNETIDIEYVGELTHILVLSYSTKVPVIVMKARWVRPADPSRHPSMEIDDDGFTLANFKQLLPADEDPYILPESVRQAYFLHHHGRNSGWRVLMRTDPRSTRVY